MALHTDLPIYRSGVRLLALAIQIQQQMPRGVKRSLGDKISQHCVDMLDLMALANGKRLADFEVKASAAKGEADKARSAGQEVDDDAADGGERDPNTGDMFEESHA